MKFFVILEILLIAARVAVEFFVLPAAAYSALTWACVICGIIAAVFIAIRIYKDIKK